MLLQQDRYALFPTTNQLKNAPHSSTLYLLHPLTVNHFHLILNLCQNEFVAERRSSFVGMRAWVRWC